MKRKLVRYFWVWLPFLITIILWWVSILTYSNAYMRGYKQAHNDVIEVLQKSNNELRIKLNSYE